MQQWDLRSLDVQPHQPEVLHSEEEGRAIAIHLPAGEQLQEHEVHERAWLVVVDGEVEVQPAQGETVTGGAGLLAIFDPHERHEVRANQDSRFLLLLAPWTGPGRDAAGNRA